MLLDFGDDYVRLKGDVADITPELRAANPHIAFFEKVNPTWRRGTEVPCIGACDYESLFRSIVDVPVKWVRKHLLGTHRPAGLDVERKPARSVVWRESDAEGIEQGRTL